MARFDLLVVEASPGIFTLDASGIGPGAILNQDLTVNTPLNRGAGVPPSPCLPMAPAKRTHQVLTVRFQSRSCRNPYCRYPRRSPGLDAPVQYAGAAPGMIAGVLQVNCLVPLSAPPGYSVPIVLAVGQTASQEWRYAGHQIRSDSLPLLAVTLLISSA